MLKPTQTISYLKHQDIKNKDSLNILCWNVAKLTQKDIFKDFLKELVKKEKLNFCVLQEVKGNINSCNKIFEKFSFVLSPNIQTKRNIYGVANIFNISCLSNEVLITKKRELKLATYKSILITKHVLNNKNITVVNIHALNFVAYEDFKYELEILKEHLKNYDDALIVAGDFNTWNKKRVLLLNKFCKELSLEEVSFNNDKNIKKVFNNSLDYIFFRALKLEYSKVINIKSISDHNPIIASFSI